MVLPHLSLSDAIHQPNPKLDWKTYTEMDEHNLTLLRHKVVSALYQSDVFPVISFIQEGALPYYTNPVKRFLLSIFGEDTLINRG